MNRSEQLLRALIKEAIKQELNEGILDTFSNTVNNISNKAKSTYQQGKNFVQQKKSNPAETAKAKQALTKLETSGNLNAEYAQQYLDILQNDPSQESKQAFDSWNLKIQKLKNSNQKNKISNQVDQQHNNQQNLKPPSLRAQTRSYNDVWSHLDELKRK
jgi:cobalamin biosynthesis protein CobT